MFNNINNFVIISLVMASLSNLSSVAAAPPPNRYADWRKSGIPVFAYRPLAVDLNRVPYDQKGMVKSRCIERYKKSLVSFDQSIADAALAYVHQDGDLKSAKPGPLLLFAQKFSRRLYKLYSLYCRYEMDKGVPMIPVDAGQLKNHGFISEEIIKMQESCCEFMEILTAVKKAVAGNQYEEFFKALTSPEGRKKLAESVRDKPALLEAVQKYEALKEKALIDRACFMMVKFGHLSVREVEIQLSAIAVMEPNEKAPLDSRILMEIRHRVAGDGRGQNGSPGCLGSNPLAYRSVIYLGDPEHLEGEFRGLMYFAYMNNHFVNACMQDQAFMEFANKMLNEDDAAWEIDPEFVAAMSVREPQFLPPVFRYGQNAALNSSVREYSWDPSFYERHPQPLLKDVMTGRCSPDSSFRHPLSSRELMNQIGDFREQAVSPHRPIKMWSGGSIFRIRHSEEIDDSPQGRAAKQYVEMCEALRLPRVASISGTYDQMAAMAGFVQAALKPDELEILKVAMIAFMVPARDHSVDEILQSSKSYNLDYEPGPGFERFIYPSMGNAFLSRIYAEVEKRNEHRPAYYLSADYTEQLYKQVMNHD